MQDMVGATTMFYATRSSATATGWNVPEPVVDADTSVTATLTSIAFGPSTHVVVGTTNAVNTAAIYDATFDASTKMVSSFTMLEPGGSNPFLTADGMHLYFDATNGVGGSALFVASRRSPTEAFAPEVQLVELDNGDSVDTAAWVASGAHTIYFASRRLGATVPALYSAQRTSF